MSSPKEVPSPSAVANHIAELVLRREFDRIPIVGDADLPAGINVANQVATVVSEKGNIEDFPVVLDPAFPRETFREIEAERGKQQEEIYGRIDRFLISNIVQPPKITEEEEVVRLANRFPNFKRVNVNMFKGQGEFGLANELDQFTFEDVAAWADLRHEQMIIEEEKPVKILQWKRIKRVTRKASELDRLQRKE